MRRLAEGGVKLDRQRVVANSAAPFELVDVQRGVEEILVDVGQERFDTPWGALFVTQYPLFDLGGCGV